MPLDQPFNTACKNCRVAKTKCLRIDNDDEKCRRCRGAGWECSLMPRAARKRRKRMDARVEVLEGQLRELEGLMGRAKGKGVFEDGMVVDVPPAMMLPLTPDSGLGSMVSAPSLDQNRGIAEIDNMDLDITADTMISLPGVVPDLLTFDHANMLFDKFKNETVAQFPLLHIPSAATFSDLSTEAPTLLLATITAASMSTSGTLFKALHAELTKRLAMKVIVSGERSLELVQALLVMEIWYDFPEGMDEGKGVNFYQWIHIAATMVLQLGLGVWGSDLERSMEEARILLAVWASCSSAAVSLRRENIMKFTPSLLECLKRFEEHAASVNDKCILARVKLQMISEEAQSITPAQEHIRSSFLSKTTDLAAQVYCFQRQLEAWKVGLEEGVMNESLLIHYLYIKTKVLEIPLHAYHDLSTLIAYPFVCRDARTHQQSVPSILTPVYMRVAKPFLDSCHNLLETFASFSADTLANLPTVPFVRAIYALNALQMLIRGPAFQGHLEAKRRMDDVRAKVEKVLEEAVGSEERRAPKAVLGVWRKIGGKEEGKESVRSATLPDVLSSARPRTTERTSFPQLSPTISMQAFDLGTSNPDESQRTVDSTSTCSLQTIQDYSFAGIEDQLMETFLHGFGAADLIT